MRFWAHAMVATEQLVAEAAVLEEFGFEGLLLGEHLIAPPERTDSIYPYSDSGVPGWDRLIEFPDPWVAFGALSSLTSRLKFCSSISLLSAHGLLEAAKAIAAASAFSKGRVALGVGVGWMREEFEVTGNSFRTRGRRLDDMLEILPKLFAGEVVKHSGDFFDLPGIELSPPLPPQPVPVYVGGESEVALRRAARHDGWLSGWLRLADAAKVMDRLREYRHELGRADEPFTMNLMLRARPSVETYRLAAEAGATDISMIAGTFGSASDPPSDRREKIARFSEQFVGPLR